MSQKVPTFSLFLPQAALSYEAVRERALVVERLGYDGLWLVDHFYAQGAPDLDFVEGWTALAGIAEATSKIRIGLMVTCNSYRNPGLLAKMAATVDHIAAGRLELGMGAGWMESEYRAYGYEFPPMGTRLAQLGEALEILESLFARDRTSYEGRYYRLHDAPLAPKPVQAPLPVTIGGAGEKVLLRLVARFAHRWNCPMNSADDIPRLRQVLARHCDDFQRDPAEISTSEQCVVIVGADEADVAARRAMAEHMAGSFADLDAVAVQGTPEVVIEGLRRKIRGGVDDFALCFGDFGMPETLELFASEVMPALRSGA